MVGSFSPNMPVLRTVASVHPPQAPPIYHTHCCGMVSPQNVVTCIPSWLGMRLLLPLPSGDHSAYSAHTLAALWRGRPQSPSPQSSVPNSSLRQKDTHSLNPPTPCSSTRSPLWQPINCRLSPSCLLFMPTCSQGLQRCPPPKACRAHYTSYSSPVITANDSFLLGLEQALKWSRPLDPAPASVCTPHHKNHKSTCLMIVSPPQCLGGRQ